MRDPFKGTVSGRLVLGPRLDQVPKARKVLGDMPFVDYSKVEQLMMRHVEADPVWRALDRLRSRATGDRRLLHKNQQYAYGYGASLRKLHEMARAWPVAGRLIEASRFAHAYGTGPRKMGEGL